MHFVKWTCVFPGKMGLAWKRAWVGEGSKWEAEAEAAKTRNVVAVPVELFEHIAKMQKRVVVAEGKLNELGLTVAYDEEMKPTFIDLRKP